MNTPTIILSLCKRLSCLKILLIIKLRPAPVRLIYIKSVNTFFLNSKTNLENLLFNHYKVYQFWKPCFLDIQKFKSSPETNSTIFLITTGGSMILHEAISEIILQSFTFQNPSSQLTHDESNLKTWNCTSVPLSSISNTPLQSNYISSTTQKHPKSRSSSELQTKP